MPEARTSPDGKPYVGPRTFETNEEHLFFGRKREQRDLTALIVAKRIVLFYAASGAGKSSLFNTKIIPGLKQKGFEVLPVGSVSGHDGRTVEVENIFVYNLVSSLHEADTEPPGMATLTLTAFLDRAVCKDGAFQYDADYEYGEDAVLKPRVLLIDQFEEILTTNSPFWQQREGFFQQLGEALHLDKQLWLVLAMREDFVAGLDPYLHFLPTALRYRYYMQPLSRRAALQAIQNPVQDTRPFEEEAAALLVDNLLTLRGNGEQANGHKSQFVEPVQLQAVCYQMWQKLQSRPGATITAQDVKDFADVDKALIDFYERTIEETVRDTSVSEVDLRNWFESELITDSGTRNMVFRGEELSGSLETEIADFVLKRFILREVVRPGGVWYELVHDRFVHPVLESNKQWRLDQPLLKLAQEWLDSKRADSALLDGRQLERFLKTNWRALGPLVVEFVTSSQKVREAELAAQQQRDLEEAQKLAAAAQARERAEIEARNAAEAQRAAEEEARQQAEADAANLRRRALYLMGALAVAAVAAVLAILFFQNAQSSAEQAQENLAQATVALVAEATARADAQTNLSQAQTKEAEALAAQATADHNASVASTREAEAVAAEAEAEAERRRAEANAIEAKSNQLAFASLSVLSQQGSGENTLALMLAREAVLVALDSGLSPSVDAEAALQQTLSAAPPWISTFAGHSGSVWSALFDPTGDLIVTASDDGSAKVWDLDGNELASLEGHEDAVISAEYSPDGQLIVTNSLDGSAKVWDLVGKEVASLEGHEAAVIYAVFSPDGERIVTASDDGSAKVWDLAGNELASLEGSGSSITSAFFSPDGQRILTTSDEGVARIWDLSGFEVAALEGDSGAVTSASFSPGGERVVTTGSDGTARLWDSEGTLISVLEGHTDAVTSFSWYPGGETLATGSADGTVRLWDLLAGEPLQVLDIGSPVFSVAFSPGAQYLVIGTANAATLWLRSSTGDDFEFGRDYEGHTGTIDSVAFDPRGQRIVTASADGTARLWRVSPNDNTLVLGDTAPINDADVSPDGSRLLTASTDGTASVWDRASGRELMTLAGHSASVLSAAFSPDGSQLATTSADGTAQIWDLATGEELLILLHEDRVTSASFHVDGRRLATGSSDGRVRIWDSSSGLELAFLTGHKNAVNSVAFSPDGERLASASSDQTILIWEVENADRAPSVLYGHTDSVLTVNWHPDGQYLLSGGLDNSALVWNMSDVGAAPIVLQGHTGAVLSTSASSDGESVATASSDTTIRLWDLEGCAANPDTPCAAKQVLQGHTDSVVSAIFCPDNSCIFSASRDQTARVWDIDLSSLLDQAETLIQRRPIEFTPTERRIYGLE